MFFMKEKKICLHIFPVQNILHIFLFFRKKTYFGYGLGVPPPLRLRTGP